MSKCLEARLAHQRLPGEEFLGVRSGDGEGDDGAVDAALADEGVFGAEGEVRAHHLVADELAVSRTQTWKSKNNAKIQMIFPTYNSISTFQYPVTNMKENNCKNAPTFFLFC